MMNDEFGLMNGTIKSSCILLSSTEILYSSITLEKTNGLFNNFNPPFHPLNTQGCRNCVGCQILFTFICGIINKAEL